MISLVADHTQLDGRVLLEQIPFELHRVWDLIEHLCGQHKHKRHVRHFDTLDMVVFHVTEERRLG